jgi:hypothetical protein
VKTVRGITKHPIKPRMEKYMRRHYAVSKRLNARYFEARDALDKLLSQCGPYVIPAPLVPEHDRLERLLSDLAHRSRMMDRRLYRPSIVVAYENFRDDEGVRAAKEEKEKTKQLQRELRKQRKS